MRSVEDDRVSEDAAKGGAAGIGQILSRRFLVRGLPESDFDELMGRQSVVERRQDRGADAAFSHENNGFQGVGEAAQMAALGTVQNGDRTRFRGFGRHEELLAGQRVRTVAQRRRVYAESGPKGANRETEIRRSSLRRAEWLADEPNRWLKTSLYPWPAAWRFSSRC